MRRLIITLLLLAGLSTPVAAQQDTVSVDSVPVTRARWSHVAAIDSFRTGLDTVGWSRTVTLGSAPDTLTDSARVTPPQHIVISGTSYVLRGDTLDVVIQYTVDQWADSLYLEGPWRHAVLAKSGGKQFQPFSDPHQSTLSYDVSGVAPGQTVTARLASRTYRAGLRSGTRLDGSNIGPLWHSWTWTKSGGAPAPSPTPQPPPTGAGTLALDFNNSSDLGVNCGGGPCNWPYRKHDYDPTAGRGGGGAIVMHWQTGMIIGFSPAWIDPVPVTRHFKISYWVRQNATMIHSGSNVKLHRIRADGVFIGTLLSRNGALRWFWEGWTSNDPVSPVELNVTTPTDDQWHLYELELDYRDLTALKFTFWLDGRLARTATIASRVGDMMAGTSTLVFSPFAEMYSCGDSGACSANINTGDYVVDDFSYTVLP